MALMARTRFTPGADTTMLLDVLLACLAQEDLDPQPLADTTLHLFRRDALLCPLLDVADLDDADRLREAVAAADLAAVRSLAGCLATTLGRSPARSHSWASRLC